MAGYTRIQRKISEYVEDKFIGRIRTQINTEWETRINKDGTIPPSADEYEYFQKRALEIIAEFESQGEANEEKSTDTVSDSSGEQA